MTYTEAKKYLRRAEGRGYVAVRHGLVTDDSGDWGINFDGDGRQNRYFGCPQIIWDAEVAEGKFPARKYVRKNR